MAAHDWHRHAEQVSARHAELPDEGTAAVHPLRRQLTSIHSSAAPDDSAGPRPEGPAHVEGSAELAEDLAALTRALLGLGSAAGARVADVSRPTVEPPRFEPLFAGLKARSVPPASGDADKPGQVGQEPEPQAIESQEAGPSSTPLPSALLRDLAFLDL